MFEIPGGIAVVCDGQWFSLPTKDQIWDEEANKTHLTVAEAIAITTETIKATIEQRSLYQQLTLF